MKKLLFVDDDTKLLNGMERQLHAMRGEWQMKFMDQGPAALEFMAANPVDIIVTDLRMSGMNGAQLLENVRDRHPDTVRLVLSGQTDKEISLKLAGSAHQFLAKPCNADELRDAIKRAFAMRDLLSNDNIKRLATRMTSLPSLPSLQNQLAEEMGVENPSIERVSEIISRDIGMTTKILQLVNSAFFGLPQTFSRIDEAVQYLGLGTVRALALSLQIFSQYNQKTMIHGFSLDELASHCWQVGVFAKKIAQAEHGSPKLNDQCFLSGLLHDIGHLIIAFNLPEQSILVFERARKERMTICESERIEFGTTHAEIGGYLLALWGLPTPVVEAVSFHHRPADCFSQGFSICIAVHVANAFAHDSIELRQDWPGHGVDEECLKKMGIGNRLDFWRNRCLGNGG